MSLGHPWAPTSSLTSSDSVSGNEKPSQTRRKEGVHSTKGSSGWGQTRRQLTQTHTTNIKVLTTAFSTYAINLWSTCTLLQIRFAHEHMQTMAGCKFHHILPLSNQIGFVNVTYRLLIAPARAGSIELLDNALCSWAGQLEGLPLVNESHGQCTFPFIEHLHRTTMTVSVN